MIQKDIFYPDTGNETSAYGSNTRHNSNYSKSIEASAFKRQIFDDIQKRSMITVKPESTNSVKAIRLYGGGTRLVSSTKRTKSPLTPIRYKSP